MKEILRTTDPVYISWLIALLAEQGIELIVLDTHTSVIEGSIGAIPRRLMVLDGDHAAAVALIAAAGKVGRNGDVSGDRLLGGRVVLRQPTLGYRAAIDPVLLAAAVPQADAVLDAGAGAGAAALCYAARVPAARIRGLELQADLARLAEENAAANGMGDRVAVFAGDLLDPPPGLEPGSFAEVMANPPYLPASRADPSPDPAKAAANVEGRARLADWIDFCLAMARPKGGVTLVHRADRLDEILALMAGRAGGIVVFPLWPAAGRDAKRVLLRARKGIGTPLRLAAGLVLHEAGGGYTEAALQVLRDGAPLRI